MPISGVVNVYVTGAFETRSISCVSDFTTFSKGSDVVTPPPPVLEPLLLPLDGGGVTVPFGTTVKVAMAGRVLLPLLVCKMLAGSVLMKIPPSAAVTFTVTVQLPAMLPILAGIVVPDDKVTLVPPAVAFAVPPRQVVLLFGMGAIITPAGKVSMSGAVKVATLVFGLDSVIVRVEILVSLMVNGLNPLPSVGGPLGVTTVKVAMAGAVLEP
jgi:hypothetical protein